MSELEEIKLNTEKILLLLENKQDGKSIDNIIHTLQKCKDIFGNISLEQAILEFDIIKRI